MKWYKNRTSCDYRPSLVWARCLLQRWKICGWYSDHRVFQPEKGMTKTLEEIARDFEKENPKVKVKVVNVPNAGEVLKTRVLAGDVPDVVNIYPQSIELQEWAKAGVFEDLSNKDYLKRVKNGYAENMP